MRAAPPVDVPLDGGALFWWVGSLLHALAGASLAWWCIAHVCSAASLARPTGAMITGACVLVVVAAWLGGRLSVGLAGSSVPTALRWSGRDWSLIAAVRLAPTEPSPPPLRVAVQVMIDGGPWMLLRLHALEGPPGPSGSPVRTWAVARSGRQAAGWRAARAALQAHAVALAAARHPG